MVSLKTRAKVKKNVFLGVREIKSARKFSKSEVRENLSARKFSDFAQPGCAKICPRAKIYTNEVVGKLVISTLLLQSIAIEQDEGRDWSDASSDEDVTTPPRRYGLH